MTAATTKDSPTTPGDPQYRRALVSLREVPTRALGQILIVGASVNLLVSAALRLSANDHRLLFPPLNGTTGDLHRSCAGCVAFWL